VQKNVGGYEGSGVVFLAHLFSTFCFDHCFITGHLCAVLPDNVCFCHFYLLSSDGDGWFLSFVYISGNWIRFSCGTVYCFCLIVLIIQLWLVFDKLYIDNLRSFFFDCIAGSVNLTAVSCGHVIHRVTVTQFLHTISMWAVFLAWCDGASSAKCLILWHHLS